MPNGTYGGVRGRETKVGRKLSFSSYSMIQRRVESLLSKAAQYHKKRHLRQQDAVLLQF